MFHEIMHPKCLNTKDFYNVSKMFKHVKIYVSAKVIIAFASTLKKNTMSIKFRTFLNGKVFFHFFMGKMQPIRTFSLLLIKIIASIYLFILYAIH